MVPGNDRPRCSLHRYGAAGNTEDFARSDQFQTNLAAIRPQAIALLEAVDEGQPAGPLARALALDALRVTVPDSAPWLLAVLVVEGGPLRMRNAVELAGHVVELLAQVAGDCSVAG